MDVVKTNIQKLNGSIDIRSEPGKGSVFIISLPLTLAILPVLLVLLGDQPALPLSLVREILPIEHAHKIQEVGGKETLVVRRVLVLSRWPPPRLALDRHPEYGVFMQTAENAVSFSGGQFCRPRRRGDQIPRRFPAEGGGVTTLSNGQIVP